MKRKEFISVVIPVYNSEKTIKRCLEALYNNSYKIFECIVVDDCSKDNSVSIAKKFPCKVLRLKKNRGPAKARNFGAANAKGDILFFVDSDVLLLPKALKEIIKSFNKEPDIAGVVGIYDKEPVNKGFFAHYMALRKFSDFTESKKKYFSHIGGACSAVKKKIFFECGGFPDSYKGADVEDYVLGYNITSKYKLLFNPKLRGKHYMPTFKTCFKNYFKRSSMWFRLFIKRRKFDSGAATPSRGISSISTLFVLLFFVLSLFNSGFVWLFLLFIGIFLYTNRKFYSLALKEKGLKFFIASVFTNFVLFLSVSFGVIYSITTYLFKAN
jgi:glycosyltransferase involved in cell wall biosynthesis